MFGRRAFSMSGPAAWNSLPDYPRDQSRFFDSFRRNLKTFFSFTFLVIHSALEALRGFAIMRYINLLLILTLTYPSHAHSPARRHHDLFRNDWLQILQRTRSLSSEHVHFSGTVHTHRASAKLAVALLRAAYRRVYDSRHLQADCQEPGSAPEPYAR